MPEATTTNLSQLIRDAKRRESRRSAPAITIATPVGPRRLAWGKLGIRGVYLMGNGKYRAEIRIAGTLHRLGTFATLDIAARVVDAFMKERMPNGGRGDG